MAKTSQNVFNRVWNLWLGDRGERLAARYLKRKGLKILARGYRLTRGHRGEIDLIAREGDRLVFVEVKTRTHGDPFEAIDHRKQQILTRTALRFMKRYGVSNVPMRFDVVTVLWPDADQCGQPRIHHYRHAFEPVDGPTHTS